MPDPGKPKRKPSEKRRRGKWTPPRNPWDSIFVAPLIYSLFLIKTFHDEKFMGVVEAEIGRNDGLISSLRTKTRACKDKAGKSGMAEEIAARIRLKGELERIVKVVVSDMEFSEKMVKMMGMIPLRAPNRVAAKGGRETKGHR